MPLETNWSLNLFLSPGYIYSITTVKTMKYTREFIFDNFRPKIGMYQLSTGRRELESISHVTTLRSSSHRWWGAHIYVSKLANRPTLTYSTQSHYPNQCLLIVKYTSMNEFQRNCNQTQCIYTKINLKRSSLKWHPFQLSRPHCVNSPRPSDAFLCR